MKFSIVTIVLNDKNNIEKTIQSVLNQNIEIEYIIIDGGSTDGTLEVIEKYRDKIDILVSEKDDGIYNAMNKATEKANGEWVCFMNSGDGFYNSNVLKNILPNIENSLDVVYGDWEVRYASKNKIKKANKSRIEIEKEKYLKLIDKITGGDKTQATILKGCLKAKTDIFNFKGEVVGRKPDYKTRLDTIKYIDKLKGREDIKKVTNNNQQNNFIVEELNKFYK